MPIFGRSVNPMGFRFCPPFTTGTPKCFHLPASLLNGDELEENDININLNVKESRKTVNLVKKDRCENCSI